MRKDAFNPIVLMTRLSTPINLIGIGLVLELMWFFMPAWLGLFGFSMQHMATTYRGVDLFLAVLVGFGLLATIAGFHLRRYAAMKHPPLRDVYYRPMASLVNLFLAIAFPAALLVAGFVMGGLWQLLFNATVLAHVAFWKKEFAPSKERALCDLILKLGLPKAGGRDGLRRSPDSMALMIAETPFTQLTGMLMVGELAVLNIWRLNHEWSGTLFFAVTVLIGGTIIYLALYLPARRMARRVKRDIDLREKQGS